MSKLSKRLQRLRRRLFAATPEQLTTLGAHLPAGSASIRSIEVEYEDHGITVGLTPDLFFVRAASTSIEVDRGCLRQHGQPVSNAKYLIELGLVLLDVLLPT